MGKTRSNLYRAARVLGDLEAASKGPGAMVKRLVRKAAYRKTNGALASILKGLGL